MNTATPKRLLLLMHRWLGLIVAPLFALILVTGVILAFNPVIEDTIRGAAQPLNIDQLVGTLNHIDPQGQAKKMQLSPDGKTVTLTGNGLGTVIADVASGRILPDAEPSTWYHTTKSLHKKLLIGADTLIEIAAWLMVGIIIVGPFLGKLHLRNTAAGWHNSIGWLVWPLLLFVPLTGVLMTFSALKSGIPVIEGQAPGITQAIVAVQANPPQNFNLQHLMSAGPGKRGGTMLVSNGRAGDHRVVMDNRGNIYDSGPPLVKILHEGTWAGLWSGLFNIVISLMLLALTATGCYGWLRRFRRQRAEAAITLTAGDVLIAYGSQTGTAAKLAQATQQAFARSGLKAVCASLATVKPADLAAYRYFLPIVSSTGDGEMPDPARTFAHQLGNGAGLQTPFALLGLGDKHYPHFCGGAEQLRNVLLKAGAEEKLPMARADGNPDSAWRSWLTQLSRWINVTLEQNTAPVVTASQPVTVTLKSRQRLDDNSQGPSSETWGLIFETDTAVTFHPGDLLMIAPDANATPRSYSIGSSSRIDERHFELTVGLKITPEANGDITLGKMSSLLCHTLPIGGTLSAQIRPHTDFNPPENLETPIIMVAAGCGIAPFTGFLEECAHHIRRAPAWLLFGNRCEQADLLHRERIQAWLQQGALTRFDSAWSDVGEDPAFVTARVATHGKTITEWMDNQHAVLYVCGRRRVGEGVIQALRIALQTQCALTEQEADDKLNQWEAAGQIHMDLFD